ncbi:MAG: hypothetical protein ACR2QV_08975, partial [Gammaproteobacteria bacterium]
SAARAAGVESLGSSKLFIIRNGHLSPKPRHVERKLSDISGRSVETMIQTAAGNNLYRIFAFTMREKIDFHYVDIPASHVSQATELFDLEEMNRLFEVGYELGRSDTAWHTEPPGFHVDDGEF